MGGLAHGSVKTEDPVDLYKIDAFTEIIWKTIFGIHFYTAINHFFGIGYRLFSVFVIEKVMKSTCHVGIYA